MRKRLILAGLLLLLWPVAGRAGGMLSPKEAFSAREEICLSDGNSLYVFRPDGTFALEPFEGISGRIVNGTWKLDETGVRVSGVWSWINGLSEPNDRREMDLSISYIGTESKDCISHVTGQHHKVRRAYFLIERLEKQP